MHGTYQEGSRRGEQGGQPGWRIGRNVKSEILAAAGLPWSFANRDCCQRSAARSFQAPYPGGNLVCWFPVHPGEPSWPFASIRCASIASISSSRSGIACQSRSNHRTFLIGLWRNLPHAAAVPPSPLALASRSGKSWGRSRVVLECAGPRKLGRCLSFRISLAGRCSAWHGSRKFTLSCFESLGEAGKA